MSREAVILSLKEKLRAFSPERDGGLFRSSEVPIGALSQVTGSTRVSWLVERLAEKPELSVAWIEKELSVFPTALAQRGVDLDSVLYVETGNSFADWEWAVLQVLDSQLFQLVVMAFEPVSSSAMMRTLKRFQIAAERARAAAVFLSEKETSAWPIRFRYFTEEREYERDRSAV